MTQQEWMVIYTAITEPEAHIVAGRLESEGIKAVVYRPTLGSVYGITVGEIGTTRVLVSPRDYEQALSILNDESERLSDDNSRIIYEDDDHQ